MIDCISLLRQWRIASDPAFFERCDVAQKAWMAQSVP
jgi:hypothetical protein